LGKRKGPLPKAGNLQDRSGHADKIRLTVAADAESYGLIVSFLLGACPEQSQPLHRSRLYFIVRHTDYKNNIQTKE